MGKQEEMTKIQQENEQNLKKLTDLQQEYEKNQSELEMAKKKMEEIQCDNDNIHDGDESSSALNIHQRRRTPNSAANSMDFSSEIHEQLKNENMAQKNIIDSLESEMNKISTDLQTQTQKIKEL